MPADQPIPYAGERWFVLLKEAVARSSMGAVAAQLGYTNHTGTSLVLRGKYHGNVARFAERVLAKFDRVECPHLNAELPVADCRATALGSMPTHNPMRRQHWQACQRCPKRPEETQS